MAKNVNSIEVTKNSVSSIENEKKPKNKNFWSDKINTLKEISSSEFNLKKLTGENKKKAEEISRKLLDRGHSLSKKKNPKTKKFENHYNHMSCDSSGGCHSNYKNA